MKKAYANATCSVGAVGDRYRLVFSGGTPVVDSDVPALDKLLFVVTPGSQQGIFHTVAKDGSVEGITISTYMTNLNIDIPHGGGRLVYTGTK